MGSAGCVRAGFGRKKGEWLQDVHNTVQIIIVMETSSRKLLPLLGVPPTYTARHGHGTCREGIVPSGLRRTLREQTVPRSRAGPVDSRAQRVQINYCKLRELCLPSAHVEEAVSKDERHQKFMSSYRLLLQQTPSDRHTVRFSPGHTDNCKKKNRHTCSFTDEPSHDVARYMEAIHGREQRAQAVVDMNTRLTAMLGIVGKLPLQRDISEVKQLSHHLSHFPTLLPNKATPTILEGVATRCLLETIPKGGFSLPDRGGVYLILQGCVEKKAKEEDTQQITSSLLYRGDCFGSMEESFITKPSYPMYVTRTGCMLMRITASDYLRVLQNSEATERKTKLALINSCRMLHGISPAVTAALANDIHWETVPSNSTLVCECERITRAGFIQSGECKVTMEVPQTRTKAQVVVGELGPGSCVGEGLLVGMETQPYQVTTTTRTEIGWVSSTTIRMNEVPKLISADKALSITVPSKDQLRQKHARQLMGLHWRKIKNDIVGDIRSRLRWPHQHD